MANAKLPRRVRSSASTFFERRADLYAVRQDSAADFPTAVAVIPADAERTFAIYKGRPDRDVNAADVAPVYSAGAGGPLAVPTGRVLVRLAEGIRPEQRRSAFSSAGFDIESTLSYAPTAAWLRPISGGVGDALAGLAALERLPDVAHVEPQLLLERAFRAG